MNNNVIVCAILLLIFLFAAISRKTREKLIILFLKSPDQMEKKKLEQSSPQKLRLPLPPVITEETTRKIIDKLKELKLEAQLRAMSRFRMFIEIIVPPQMFNPADMLHLGAIIGGMYPPICVVPPPTIKRHERSHQVVNDIVYHNYLFEYEGDEIPHLVIMSAEGWEKFKQATNWKLHREEVGILPPPGVDPT